MYTNTNLTIAICDSGSEEIPRPVLLTRPEEPKLLGNINSILQQLTGILIIDIDDQGQLSEAFGAIDKCLALEKTKAKLARADYDANRHIALHQLRERLCKIVKKRADGNHQP